MHNVRMERGWRDVRKSTLESYRKVFQYLETNDHLDLDNILHKLCILLVFHDRIQESLNRTAHAWNHHSIRTEGNLTPVALFELSRERGIREGWWEYDPGDPIEFAADPDYGVDGEGPLPPEGEMREEWQRTHRRADENDVGFEVDEEKAEMLAEARRLLDGRIDLNRDDMNWGIDVYIEAVTLLTAIVNEMPEGGA